MFLLNLKFSLVGNYNLLIDYWFYWPTGALCYVPDTSFKNTIDIVAEAVRHPAMFNLGEDSISFLLVMDSWK